MAFRFSEKAKENLATIVQVAGINQTAAIEMALAVLVQQLKGENMSAKIALLEELMEIRRKLIDSFGSDWWRVIPTIEGQEKDYSYAAITPEQRAAYENIQELDQRINQL